MEKSKPLTPLMKQVYAVIADAKNGEISGRSVSIWLLRRHHPDGIREALKGLERRGLIHMRPMDDPEDEFRKMFPDRMKAMFSVTKENIHALS